MEMVSSATNRTIVELKLFRSIALRDVFVYQSYHNGIETNSNNRATRYLSCYQSYHSGIETWRCLSFKFRLGPTNRTIVELKLRIETLLYWLYHWTTNRTIVELKLYLQSCGGDWTRTTNRTIVELKQNIYGNRWGHTLCYQSYHSGIETHHTCWFIYICFATNRTIVELKLIYKFKRISVVCSTNRTIVELKPVVLDLHAVSYRLPIVP